MTAAALAASSVVLSDPEPISVSAAKVLEVRKLPMVFGWHVDGATGCEPACRTWVSAVGSITSDTPKAFAAFARGRDLRGATVALDSSGGSVLDAISLGRSFRELDISTTVGLTVDQSTANAPARARLLPEAYCESMCVFLLLSGTKRYVPPEAHVRVHQIWMGDRANDAKAASYSAQDLMIVQRDIGSLVRYTLEMGGGGDLLALGLRIPPWEPLYELSAKEVRDTGLQTVDTVAELFGGPNGPAMAGATVASPLLTPTAKPIQDRFAGAPHQTADAMPQTGGATPTR